MDRHAMVDSSRIRRELGYKEIVPRLEAMRRTVGWSARDPPEPFPTEMFGYAAEDGAFESCV